MKVAAVIPGYNEARNVGSVVEGALCQLDCIVVDDGSVDQTALIAEQAGATVIRHEVNRGKGAALMTGLCFLREQGYTAAVTVDADGQHDTNEINRFVAAGQEGYDIVIGNRTLDVGTMPPQRRFANIISSALVSWATGLKIHDSQNGFRLYSLESVLNLFQGTTPRSGYDFETEVLIRGAKAGLNIGTVPTSTIYRPEAVSGIRPIVDSLHFLGTVGSCSMSC